MNPGTHRLQVMGKFKKKFKIKNKLADITHTNSQVNQGVSSVFLNN